MITKLAKSISAFEDLTGSFAEKRDRCDFARPTLGSLKAGPNGGLNNYKQFTVTDARFATRNYAYDCGFRR